MKAGILKGISEDNHIPEILAPAGTFDALKAAVNAGADAVYLGGDMFGARAYAGNFSREILLEALDYCHLFKVRVYMTVNTLFKQNEITRLAEYIRPFYEVGVDAVLLQDPGAVNVLKKEFPDLPLHASTQMSILTAFGAEFLKNQGFTRIVPARELSLEEIIDIKKKTGLEIETFVHGAMCFSYSGKCLFSSFMGSRSGNRGRCAQPCRHKYEVASEGKNKAVKEHIMSLKDMCAVEILPELIDAGIDSFKIEGRMKNPEYAAVTTSIYRSLRDLYIEKKERLGKNWADWDGSEQQAYSEEAGRCKKDLQDIYNRGGFCTGYYYTSGGKEMFSSERPNHSGLMIGTVARVNGPDIVIDICEDVNARDVVEIRPAGVELTSNVTATAGKRISLKGKELKKIRSGMKVFRTRNNELIDRIDSQIIAKERKVLADAYVEVIKGKPLSITVKEKKSNIQPECEPVEIKVEGDIAEKAQNSPVTKDKLLEKMKKTGDMHIEFDVSIESDDDAFVSMSSFNSLRRRAAEEFIKAMAFRFHRSI